MQLPKSVNKIYIEPDPGFFQSSDPDSHLNCLDLHHCSVSVTPCICVDCLVVIRTGIEGIPLKFRLFANCSSAGFATFVARSWRQGQSLAAPSCTLLTVRTPLPGAFLLVHGGLLRDCK
jgi:hypothetical protein